LKPGKQTKYSLVKAMKVKKAIRAKFKVDKLWEGPALHILLTQEYDVIVARCLDLTLSSHGNDEMDAINLLTDAVKEAILSAIENDVIGEIYDPAHSIYWRMFNEAEAKQINL
jgi:hypothetical protein